MRKKKVSILRALQVDKDDNGQTDDDGFRRRRKWRRDGDKLSRIEEGLCPRGI